MGEPSDAAPPLPAFLSKTVELPTGTYELVRPLATFRHCHDGTPPEGRLVYVCRRHVDTDADADADTDAEASSTEYVLKIKIQVARTPDQQPLPGPSTTTASELKALTRFRDARTPYAPTLLDFHTAVQPASGMLPGGFITFLLMTKLPGDSLHNLYYWGMDEGERARITEAFVAALAGVYALGVEPVDRGLRNVLWDAETGVLGLIDFELWREREVEAENGVGVRAGIGDEKDELMRWGLMRQPAAKDHWTAWNLQWR